MRHLGRLWQSNSGVGAIEFAFVSGILSLLLLGALDFGMGFWQQMEVADAAEAGADYATKNGYISTNIQTAVTNATSLPGIQASPAPSETCGCPNATSGVTTQSCSSACPNGDLPGTYVTVSAQVSYRTFFNWPGVSNPLTLSSTATVRIN